MSFAAFPPEINSGLMYAGAGAGPMLAAAAAWNNLAAELSTTATSWESIVTSLTTDQWTGAGSAAAAASAQPVIEWLTSAGVAAEQAGAQAAASAAAYEAAFAATIPPAAIAANRAQLAALVATNFLGINTPAILATEAIYAEFWVQDALAMYTYQAAAAVAAMLEPLAPAAPAASPAAAGIQESALAAADAVAPAAAVASAVAEPVPFTDYYIGELLTTALEGVLGANFVESVDGFLGTPAFFNAINGAVNTSAWFVMTAIPTAVSLGHTLAGAPLATAVTAEAVVPAAAGAALASETTAAGGAVASAGLGEASLVGSLSVPASWTAAAPVAANAGTALAGSGWTVAGEGAPVTAMPGMPGAAAAAKGAGAYGAGPRYGVKPIVMPKQVVV